MGAVAGFTMLFFLPSPRDTPAKNRLPLREKLLTIDYLGSSLIVGALVCYTRALQVAGITTPWSSSQVTGLLVGTLALFVAVCGVERALGDRAMIVRELLAMRLVIVGMVYGFFFEGAAYTILYAIPLHLQAIDGLSPMESGIRNLPFLLACGTGSVAAGYIFGRTRLAYPVIIFACGAAAAGTGLIYTLDGESSASHWIGYLVLAGLGYGAGLPIAIILGQFEVAPEDVATSTSMLMSTSPSLFSLLYKSSQAADSPPFAVSFNIGSALCLGAAQSLLDNILLSRLPILVPSVDPADVLSTGAAAIRSTFTPDVAPGIIEAYLYGLRAVYALIISFAGMALLSGLFYPGRD